MNIELFIKEMNGTHSDAVLEKHIVRKYVPFEEKLAQAQRIVDASCYKEIEGIRIYYVDSVSRYYLFIKSIIEMYTDLTFQENESLKGYNMLAENGLIDKIIEKIPDNEYITYSKIVAMVANDKAENEHDVINYFRDFGRLIADFLKSDMAKEVVEKMMGEQNG